jgi:hypothetical protein
MDAATLACAPSGAAWHGINWANVFALVSVGYAFDWTVCGMHLTHLERARGLPNPFCALNHELRGS